MLPYQHRHRSSALPRPSHCPLNSDTCHCFHSPAARYRINTAAGVHCHSPPQLGHGHALPQLCRFRMNIATGVPCRSTATTTSTQTKAFTAAAATLTLPCRLSALPQPSSCDTSTQLWACTATALPLPHQRRHRYAPPKPSHFPLNSDTGLPPQHIHCIACVSG
jgi:hypothetical protein